MFKNISKKNIVVLVIFLILLAGLILFLIKGPKKIVPTTQSELNEEQQISIVQSLNLTNEANPVSSKEKNKIVDQLKKEEAKSVPLTDAEKEAMIKALSN